jgi:hypothetical protein
LIDILKVLPARVKSAEDICARNVMTTLPYTSSDASQGKRWR